MVNEDGYLKLIDYGLAKILKESDVAQTYCGTPEYIAPEMVQQQGHDRMVDWWALGVLTFELIVGVTPFYNKSWQLMIDKIVRCNVAFPDPKFKINISASGQDFIRALLKKDPTWWIGCANDVDEIFEHPWLQNVTKEDLLKKNIVPPFLPSVKDPETMYPKDLMERKNLGETYIPYA